MIAKDVCLIFLYYILYAEDSRSIENRLGNEIVRSSINILITYMFKQVLFSCEFCKIFIKYK